MKSKPPFLWGHLKLTLAIAFAPCLIIEVAHNTSCIAKFNLVIPVIDPSLSPSVDIDILAVSIWNNKNILLKVNYRISKDITEKQKWDPDFAPSSVIVTEPPLLHEPHIGKTEAPCVKGAFSEEYTEI